MRPTTAQITAPKPPGKGAESKLHMHSGLHEAHNILLAYMTELHAEHRALPPTFFGNCRPRHHELTAMGKALVELGDRIVARGAEILAEGKAV